MTQQEIDILIASCLSGEATAEETEVLESWLDESPKNRDYYNRRKELWYSAGSRKYDYVQAYSRFLEKTSETRISRRRHFWNVAALSLSVAASLALAVLFSFKIGQNNVHFRAEQAQISVSAPLSSKSEVTLPDGSSVWLNAGSSLSYSQNYGVTDRKLHLEGEALFDIRHNEAMPLVVNVNGAEITDLGTKFNINAHDDNDLLIVSLIEGCAKVRNLVSSDRKSVVLRPNECAVIDRMHGGMTVREQNARNSGEWVNGTLFFDNVPLSYIANELTRRYGISVSIDDSKLKDVRFYCCFIGTDYSLDDVLLSMQSTGRVKFEMKGSFVRFF